MMPRTSPEAAERARALYAQGQPIKAISQETGLSTRQIYYWLDREAGAARKPGRPAATPTARRRRADLARPPGADSRRRLMSRLWKAAERQIGDIETRLGAAALSAEGAAPDGGEPARRDAEREARALAVLARVLRELTALEAVAQRPRPEAPAKGAATPEPARDPDTFRRELARRLAQLRDDGDADDAQPEGAKAAHEGRSPPPPD